MALTGPLGCIALGLTCIVASMPAHAVDVDGTFSGVVELAEALPRSRDLPHPASYYEGAPVTGSFSIHWEDPQPFEPPSGGLAMYADDAATLSFSYLLRGVTYSFDSGPWLLLLLNESAPGDPTQTLYFDPLFGGSMGLTGPVGSLYSGLDGSTLHVDPAVTYTGSNVLTSQAAQMTFVVDMTRVSIQSAAPVPEPATTALFVAGTALLAWRVRRRAGAGSSPAALAAC